MPKKLTKNVINERLSIRGYRLIDDYVNGRTNHKFWCSSGDHEFVARTDNLLSGRGCNKCSGLELLATEIVNHRLYDRGFKLLEEHKGISRNHKFWCSEGNHEFITRPNDLFRGRGCPVCSNRVKFSQEYILELFEEAQLECLEIPKTRLHTIDVKCVNNHNFTTNAKRVKRGDKCLSCCSTGFSKGKPAILYYLQVNTSDEPLYKIGITNRTVQERFCNEDLKRIEVLRELHFEDGSKAYDLERYYLDLFKNSKYSGEHVLESGGNTELFIHEIFGIT
jgi:hypothetical protein